MRSQHVHPLKDDKILTDWNGLMIAALAKGAQALGESRYREAAKRAATFILNQMRTPEGRLLHRYRDGQAGLPALVDDYAFLIWGLLELYEATFDAGYVRTALELNRDLLRYYWDDEAGAFYFTAKDAEELLVRRKEAYDGAVPSGNSVAALNLLRLGRITGEADLEAYLNIIREREIITDERYVKMARDVRSMDKISLAEPLRLIPAVSFAGPADVPHPRLTPFDVEQVNMDEIADRWNAAMRYFRGEPANLREVFGTQTHWMIMGPFANEGAFEGHDRAYPPERELDLTATYDGLDGKVRWTEHEQDGRFASVDFTKLFTPTEHVCAYALCFVTCPSEREVQVRLGTNDSGKLWLGNKLILDYPHEGTAFLDREIITATLPAGTTPILLKICNGELNWGFVFRMTDAQGHAMDDVRVTVFEPK